MLQGKYLCKSVKSVGLVLCPTDFTDLHRYNDKGLYATMNRWRIDPSSCLDTCCVDDMGVCSAFEILTFSETFLPFSLHFQNKSLSLQPR